MRQTKDAYNDPVICITGKLNLIEVCPGYWDGRTFLAVCKSLAVTNSMLLRQMNFFIGGIQQVSLKP
jgi:hypothetical protein